MHDARAVANSILRRAEGDEGLTPLQVQKLVYFCHAWMLAVYGRPMLAQPFQAWLYGPTVPSLHRSLKHFGAEPVNRLIGGFGIAQLDEQQTRIAHQVFAKYGHLSGTHLMKLTQIPGAPWYQVFFDPERGRTAVIPNDLIRRYYADLLMRMRRRNAYQPYPDTAPPS